MSKWLAWHPEPGPISGSDGFVGFDASVLACIQKIEPETEPAQPSIVNYITNNNVNGTHIYISAKPCGDVKFDTNTRIEPTKPSEHTDKFDTNARNKTTKPSEPAERWLTWDAWMAEQRKRIFAEAAARRTKPEPARTRSFVPSEHQIAPPSTFERLFFDQLAKLPARSRMALLEQGRAVGIPKEACEAYWDAIRKDVAA
jgi:hypothetical protein